MTQIQVSFDEETLRKVLLGDKGAEVLLEKVMNEILQAEMTEHLGAGPREQTDDRRGYRNGSYERKLTTRVGSLTLEVPRDRDGTFQTDLFERYQRSEKALVTTLMQMVIEGVSTRRVKEITTELCGREFSRQTVSDLTEKLDKQVEAWAERPLEEEYPFLLADAMRINVRRQGAVRSTQALIVVGISEEGYREILGLKIALRETGESWKELFEELKDRGLRRVELATSDAHEGLEAALRSSFPGCIWQRCQAHFRRNVPRQDAFGLSRPNARAARSDSRSRFSEAGPAAARKKRSRPEGGGSSRSRSSGRWPLRRYGGPGSSGKVSSAAPNLQHARTTHPGGSSSREGDPHLSKQGLSLAAGWGLAGRKT